MERFRDSTTVLADTAVLRVLLARDGYLFIRGLIPRDVVMGLAGQALGIAARAGWLDAAHPVGEAVADVSASCTDPEPGYLATLGEIYRLQALHELQHHPAVIDLFERVLGEAVLPRPRLIPRIFFPESDALTTAPHQDYPYVQGTTEVFTLWTPLGDCPAALGALQVAEGSHLAGVREFKISQHAATALEVADPLEGAWRGGDFAAGDVVVFHSLTVHRGSPNLTNRLRLSADFRFQRASDPITPASCKPFVTALSWEEIYAEWSSDRLQYYWRRPGTRHVEYDMKYFNQRDEVAFALAEAGDAAARHVLLRITQNDPDAGKRARAMGLLERLG